MRFLTSFLALVALVSAAIFDNDKPRLNPYPGQVTPVASSNNNSWRAYPPDAEELSYKGRWDSKHISWWSAPGLKFGFTGNTVAISFGQYTSPGVLVAYRFAGQDWLFSNVTANSTYRFISPSTPGFNLTLPENGPQTFELRVTNYAYGVQIAQVWTARNSTLLKIPDYPLTLEVIGDSLSSGFTNSYEGLSSYAWGLGEGLGNVEFSITAYPGICVHDTNCWGNPRGQTYQWLQTSDTSYRASQIYGEEPEPWNFKAHSPADLVVINIGTNDNNTHNNVTNEQYYSSYIQLVDSVHSTWPKAQIILLSLWNGFDALGNSFAQGGAFIQEIQDVDKHFASGQYAGEKEFVHYFNTTGILQKNDIAPQYHPTDTGHVKLASHLMQYIKLKFGWVLGATGPEVFSHTLYWNDETLY